MFVASVAWARALGLKSACKMSILAPCGWSHRGPPGVGAYRRRGKHDRTGFAAFPPFGKGQYGSAQILPLGLQSVPLQGEVFL